MGFWGWGRVLPSWLIALVEDASLLMRGGETSFPTGHACGLFHFCLSTLCESAHPSLEIFPPTALGLFIGSSSSFRCFFDLLSLCIVMVLATTFFVLPRSFRGGGGPLSHGVGLFIVSVNILRNLTPSVFFCLFASEVLAVRALERY